jgi:ATP-binding cassette subfamily B multidrug efflux pump
MRNIEDSSGFVATYHSSPSEITQPFRHYINKHRRLFATGVAALFFTNLFDVLTPLALKAGIDAIAGKNPSNLSSAILVYAGLMVGVTLFRYLWRIYFARFHLFVADDLRNRIFAKLTSLGPSFYSRSPTGQLMSLITNDVNSFRMAIGPGLLILLDACFYIGMILPLMSSISLDWTWKTLILLPAVPFLMRRMETLIHERFRIQQDRLSDVSARAQEIVSGIRVIKSFAQEENQSRDFNHHSRLFETSCNRVAIADGAFHPMMESVVAIGTVSLLWFGSEAVIRDQVTIGTFVAFHEYVRRMVWPMSAIGMGLSMFEQGRASYDRIRELLETSTDIPDTGTQTLEKFEQLEIRDLTFRYPGATVDALDKVSFSISAGETIGIVGPIGSGKTTLLNLISRMKATQTGAIRINGKDIADIKRESLTHLISYVTQDAFLFSETIAENLALGLNSLPEMDRLQDATEMVDLHREVQEIPGSYQAFLGERGVNLSGGQKQRLTIARALIRDSQIVILDDSLSAVDGRTEKTITSELRGVNQKVRSQPVNLDSNQALDHSKSPSERSPQGNSKQTVILVSHRLATLKHADRILVMNQGRIEAIGSHQQLLEECETYRLLDRLQAAPPALIEGGPS